MPETLKNIMIRSFAARITALATLLLLTIASTAWAQPAPTNWTNTTNTNAEWNNSGNWSGGSVPTANQRTSFNQPGTYQVDWNAAVGNTQAGILDVVFGDVTFRNTDAGNYTHTTNGSVSVSRNGGLTLDRVNLSTSGSVGVIGDSSGSTLTISNGSQVSSSSGLFSAEASFLNPSFASVDVTGSGSQWTVANRIDLAPIGDSGVIGSTVLNITSGGRVEANQIEAETGNSSTDFVAVLVSGSGSHLQVNDSYVLPLGPLQGVKTTIEGGATATIVGDSTVGRLIVTDSGSRFETGNLSVGSFFSGGSLDLDMGTIAVSGTSTFGPGASINVTSGRFEFGSTDDAAYGAINATGGALAGLVHVNGFRSTANTDSDFGFASVDTSEVAIANAGTISGAGTVTRDFTNELGGQIRTITGQSARFTAAGITNAGQVNAFGGSIEFDQGVTNLAGGEINNTGGAIIASQIQNDAGGLISGRGVFQAGGGIVNEGTIAMSASVSDFFGDVENAAGGVIISTGDGTITFHDDVVHNGTEIRTAAGSNTVFLGSLTGAGAFTGLGDVLVEGDLQPGNSPAAVSFAGNLTLGQSASTEIELGGLNVGEFDQLLIDGDFDVDGNLSVSLIDGFELAANQQFLIADVGGVLSGQFSGLDEGDAVGIFGGHELFVTYEGFGGNGIGLFTTVPEPSSLVMLSIAAITVIGRRKSGTPSGSSKGRPSRREREDRLLKIHPQGVT